LAEALRATDHRDHRRLQQLGMAQHGQYRRRVLDRGQACRVERLTPAHQARAEAVERRQFRLGLTPRHRGDRAGQPRQRVERRFRGAKAAQQCVEGDRADRFGAAEAQPVQALLRIELARGQDD
jgi:hypothetical protein